MISLGGHPEESIAEYVEQLMPVWMDYASATSRRASKEDALHTLNRVLRELCERRLVAHYGKPRPNDFVVCHGAYRSPLLLVDNAREIVFLSEALANGCAEWYAAHYYVPVQVICMGMQFDSSAIQARYVCAFFV